jgi:hypothetical protein
MRKAVRWTPDGGDVKGEEAGRGTLVFGGEFGGGAIVVGVGGDMG